MKGKKMELQLHNVQSISLKSFDHEGDDPYKIIRIKINGWQNVITLYCKEDVRLDVPNIPFENNLDISEAELDAWQDDGGEG
jgi:hypothetical protein